LGERLRRQCGPGRGTDDTVLLQSALTLEAPHGSFGFAIESTISNQGEALLIERCLQSLHLGVQFRRCMLEAII
jgi:hypothetical protein